MNNSAIYDPGLYEQAGIDPRKVLGKKGIPPATFTGLDTEFKKILRIKDEQDAVNSLCAYNFPNIDSQLLERMLYYKYWLIQFYYKPLDKFFIMPFALNGSIDFYGRFNQVRALPWYEGTNNEDKKIAKAQEELLSGYTLKVYHEIPTDPLTQEEREHAAVIFRDYTPQRGEAALPRAQLQEPILQIMSELMPYMRTALSNSTGISGVRVNDTDEVATVFDKNNEVRRAALNGLRWVPFIGKLEFQELTNGSVATADQFLLAMQSLDELRKSGHGLQVQGIFNKSAYVNEAQVERMGMGNNIIADRLLQRQKSCDIANAIWGIGESYEAAEQSIQADMDMDGDTLEGNDQSGVPGDQPEGATE